MKLLFVLGTRPEAIKMAPLIREFRRHPHPFEVKICVTAQHREMLDSALSFFDIEPDYDLNLMKPKQSLFDITSMGIKALESVLNDFKPGVVFVQGDTTSSFIGGLAAYYKQVKIAHIEAGLRSRSKYSPFPEEMNRTLISKLADFHFAPTNNAKENLSNEGIKDGVWVVGNTVVDALFLTLDLIKKSGDTDYMNFFKQYHIDFSKKLILLTLHRRENLGAPLKNIMAGIRELSAKYRNVSFVYPVHPHVSNQHSIKTMLKDSPGVHLLPHLDYHHFIWMLNQSVMVMTDSGGIQEEAPYLKKPVFVLRRNTERQESIEQGSSKLLGTTKAFIVDEISRYLDNPSLLGNGYPSNIYGDGRTSEKIIKIIESQLALSRI